MRVISPGRDGFRARLMESLARTGLKQSEVGRRVGVKRATVSAWVAGTRTPDLETTRKLAAIFEWRTAELLSWFGIYEPVAPHVDSQRQVLDTSTVLSGTLREPAGGTTPVPSTAHTGADPQKELVVVPSPEHRALYMMLSSLSLAELQPVAKMATDLFLRHFGAAREEKAEGA